MGDLNLFQQICLQIFTADLAGAFVGPEWLLQKAANLAVNLMMDNWLSKYGWKLTWGPRVWKNPESATFAGCDNCWMISMAPGVAYPDGSKHDTYVVSIAGTAVFSKSDWVQEDFAVQNVISFDAFTKTFKDGPIPKPQEDPEPLGGAPYCALGTALGVYELVVNPSPDGNPGENTTILQYLAGLNKDGGDFRVIFAGHSLGGALSPFLSLAVKANALIPALVDNPENILTFPAAGATPGDGTLRDAYNLLFPMSGPGGYQQWNGDLYNSLDIVPHAWSTDDKNDRCLDNIVGIYGKLDDQLHGRIQKLVDWGKARADRSDIVYQPIQGNRFTGSLPDQPPDNLVGFIIQIVKQHTKAYYDEVSVSDALAQSYAAMASVDGIKKKTTYQAAAGFPVFSKAASIAQGGCKGTPDGLEGGDDFKDLLDSTANPYDCILGD